MSGIINKNSIEFLDKDNKAILNKIIEDNSSYTDDELAKAAETIYDSMDKNEEKIFNLGNRFVNYQYEQLQQRFKHISLVTKNGSFPRNGTLLFIKQVKEFSSTLGYNKEKNLNVDLSAFSEEAAKNALNEDVKIADSIIKDPQLWYDKLKGRLEEDPNAKTPEFEHMVKYLLAYSNEEKILENSHEDNFFNSMRNNAVKSLLDVLNNGCPYLDTIDAIEKFTGFLDVYMRGRDNGGNDPSSLYHSVRWGYHVHEIKNSIPGCIIVPTLKALGVTEFLKTRHIPIYFVGAAVDFMYADGHNQTPFEFWVHDFNHSRRMYEQQEIHAADLNLPMKDYIEICKTEVIDKLKNTVFSIPKNLSERDKNLRRIQKAILFEIVHEEAMPPHPDIILQALLRAPLAEGTMFINERVENGKVIYSKDPSSTLLAFVYRKVAGDFYDSPSMRIEGLGQDEYRTPEFISEAAIELCKTLGLGLNQEQKDILKYNPTDDSGFPLGFRARVQKLIDEGVMKKELYEPGGQGAGFKVTVDPKIHKPKSLT